MLKVVSLLLSVFLAVSLFSCSSSDSGSNAQCTVENTLTIPSPDYPAYFAIKADGIINDSKSYTRPVSAYTTKSSFKLANYPNKSLSSSFIFYQDATLPDDLPAVILSALGDPGSKYYTTQIFITLPIADLISIKDSGITAIAGGSQTIVFIIEELNNVSIIKTCTVALSNPDNSDTSFTGIGKICADGNTIFAIGETMNFGTNVLLNEDKAFLMQALQVTTEAELCYCIDAVTSAAVDCPVAASN